MRLLGSARRQPGWLCINLLPDRVDIAHILARDAARPEVLLCDSYRKEGDAAATLRRLRRQLDLGRYRCTTLLKPGEYQMLPVEAPNVPAAEMKAAVRWRLKDLIDYPVEAATVDALTIPAGSAGRGQKLIAVAARNDVIAATVKPFNEADVPLEAIDVPELAQRNIAHRFETPGQGLALLAFDDQGGLLTFTCDGELYQHRRIEISVAMLATAVPEQRAALRERIVLELQRSLDNFDRQFHHIAVSKVMLAPVPGAEDLAERLASGLSVPVVPVDLAQALDFPGVPELRQAACQARCLQQLGASLRDEAPAA